MQSDHGKCIITGIICAMIFGIVFPGMWFLSDHFESEKVRIEKIKSDRIETILENLKSTFLGKDDREAILKALVLMDSISEKNAKKVEGELGKR